MNINPEKISRYKNIRAYITRDGSEIRELMHPDTQGNKQQSLAEAIVKPGEKTLLHRHNKSEELYYIIQGKGCMQLNEKTLHTETGDCICIPPGTAHCIENTGDTDLKILCCCSPAYSHDDTELVQA
ncbi:MAG TPA: cupin domain-containing protein [Gammaproteobacteria bacterium]|nr:cupin domain-containing protein [Gammaproteobacteria bacterium]